MQGATPRASFLRGTMMGPRLENCTQVRDPFLTSSAYLTPFFSRRMPLSSQSSQRLETNQLMKPQDGGFKPLSFSLKALAIAFWQWVT
jgi:hypothetical protein